MDDQLDLKTVNQKKNITSPKKNINLIWQSIKDIIKDWPVELKKAKTQDDKT